MWLSGSCLTFGIFDQHRFAAQAALCGPTKARKSSSYSCSGPWWWPDVGRDDGNIYPCVNHPADLYLWGSRLRHCNSAHCIRSLIIYDLSPTHLGLTSGSEALVSSLCRLYFGDRRLKRDELGNLCFWGDCHGSSRDLNQSVYLPSEMCQYCQGAQNHLVE